ncbi:MAG: stage III sporulation protein AA [Clostridia bacterium]|nr:stage III sporulation protein AA [Clostridia bacterium]
MDRSVLSIIKCFGTELYNALKDAQDDISEIRIRKEKSVVVYKQNIPYAVTKQGLTALELDNAKNEYITVSEALIKDAFAQLCSYSVYRFQNDINNGFITVNGGHRIGICGTYVGENGIMRSVRDITSLNIRIAREYKGCSRKLADIAGCEGGILICGVPSTGKTTMLRDISRLFSTEKMLKVSVVDERGELSAYSHTSNGFDLGLCDIYCGYPKQKAVICAVRTMSPDFIVCDELTGEDIESVCFTVNYGVKMIASVHCDSLENGLKNVSLFRLLKTGAFNKVVFLNRSIIGKIDAVYNIGDIQKLYE